LLFILAFLAAPVAHFDKTVHDFGTITVADGPQTCCFTLINESGSEVSILAAVASCGCTEVEWTREVIPSGKEGKVTATFANDDGPYPFDKTLTVYLSSSDKPVMLHLKGKVVKKK